MEEDPMIEDRQQNRRGVEWTTRRQRRLNALRMLVAQDGDLEVPAEDVAACIIRGALVVSVSSSYSSPTPTPRRHQPHPRLSL